MMSWNDLEKGQNETATNTSHNLRSLLKMTWAKPEQGLPVNTYRILSTRQAGLQSGGTLAP